MVFCQPLKRLAISLLLVSAFALGCASPTVDEPHDAGIDGSLTDVSADTPFYDFGSDSTITDATFDISPDIIDTDSAPDAGGDYIHGSLPLSFDLQVNGHGQTQIGAVSIQHDLGQITLGSQIPALVYETTDWAAYNIRLYHVLAPEADNLNVLYLYCGRDSSSTLNHIWHEAYGKEIYVETASGSCTYASQSVTVPVEILNLKQVPEDSRLITGFSVTGDNINIGDRGGTLDIASRSFSLYPFSLVDCTTDCGSPGWWELHMVMAEPDANDICFGIIYLWTNDHDKAQLGYGFCLRTLKKISTQVFEATWTGPAGGGGEFTPRGPKDPKTGFVLRPQIRLK